jgi:localization factor PodJL
MRHTVPWSVKGVDQDAREAAKEAARRSGMSLGEWLNSAIAEQAAEAAAAAQVDNGLSTVTRRLDSISQRLDAVTRRESETAIPKTPLVRGDNSDIVRALDAVARLAEISERRSAAAIEAVERLGSARAVPAAPPPRPSLAQPVDRADHTAQLDAIARSIRSLDMPAPRQSEAVDGSMMPPRSFRRDIDSAVAEIAERQKALARGDREAPARMAAPAAAAEAPLMPDMAPIAARLDALSRQIEQALSQPRPQPPRPQDTNALAGEIGRLSQRIDAMSAAPADGLHEEIKSLSGRVEQMRREFAERQSGQYDRAVAELRSDIAAIADQLSDLAPRRAVASLEAEVQGLGARLDAARAQGLSAEPLEALVHEFEQALARLMPAEGIAEELKALSVRVDSLASRGLSNGVIETLAAETSAIRAMLADTVSRDAIDALGDQIAALGRRIDELADQRRPGSDVAAITSAIEARIEEIAERLASAPRPAAPASNPQLEEALRRLADKLEDSHARPEDPKALAEIERHILSLAAKIDAADGRFAQLGTIERGLSDLFVQMEEMRAGTIEAAEQAARKALAAAPAAGTDEEIEALRREIEEVRKARLVADTKGAETVDAVQQTFERVARRIAEIEPADAPVAASPPLAPVNAEPALARPRAPAGAVVAERPAAPVSRQAAPSRPPGSVDLPLEPGSGAPRVRPPAPGAAPAGGSKTDFIAAARRAARAAAVDPVQRSEPEEQAKASFFARFRGAPKSQDEVDLPAPEAKKPRWRSKAAHTEAAPAIAGPEPVALAADGAEGEGKPVVSVNRKTILMGIAAALLVLAAGIATMPKIRSLMDATGTQRAAAPAASVEAPAAAPIAGIPAAPSAAAPAASFSPASTSSTPAELTPPAATPAVTDPAPAVPEGDASAPETTGSVTAARTPPPGMTVSPSGWQPVDTRTGRALSVPAALKAAADGGDPLAAYEMGTRHLEGRGVAVSAAEAAKWYQRAADAGVVPAQYRLGSLYEKGTGVLRDFERARRLYERAGEAGNAKAMHNLAVMFAQGQASPRPDYKTAAQWFRRAAEHGVADSQYNLGILYARGLGVDQSLAESYKWFALAAAGGDQDAGKKRDEVAARLDPQTLVAARLAVQTFAPKTEPDAAVRIAAPAEWADPPAQAAPAQPARPAPRRAQSSR